MESRLQSLFDVFNQKIFRIPDYQRGYAWGEKQLREFWEDLISLDKSRSHYTGMISLEKVERSIWETWQDVRWLIEDRRFTPFFVVDGQQRMITAVIFLQALMEISREVFQDKKDDEILMSSYNLKTIAEAFLVVAHPKGVIKTYKFGYENSDNPSFKFLRHRIFDEPQGGTVRETFYTLNLENAKNFFKTNLKALVEKEGESVLETVFCKLTHNFMFNVNEISDDFDVFVAFETMNNRGKKLSDLELLKNRLIYLTTLYSEDELGDDEMEEIRKNINDAWSEVYYQLGRNKRNPLKDDDFLRAHWIMYFKYSRKTGQDYIRFLLDEQFSPKKILERVKVRIDSIEMVEEIGEENSEDDLEENNDISEKDNCGGMKLKPVEINDYVLSLKEAAKHWYNCYNPEENEELSGEEQRWINRLNRMHISYFRPLVMSLFAAGGISSKKRCDLLQAIERFIFLALRVSRAQANYKSSKYYKAARDLYRGETSVDTIIKNLEEDLRVFLEDDKFKNTSFKDYINRKYRSNEGGFYGWKGGGLDYFLFEYEEHLREARGVPKISWENFVKNKKDKVSIEHIYPQKADAACWERDYGEFSSSQKLYLRGSLGNLLALSASVNSSLQNDCFGEKKGTKVDDKGNVLRNGYDNGSYSEQEVARYEQWTAVQIKERGLKLLEFMEKRWKIDLGSVEEKIDLLHLSFLLSK